MCIALSHFKQQSHNDNIVLNSCNEFFSEFSHYSKQIPITYPITSANWITKEFHVESNTQKLMWNFMHFQVIWISHLNFYVKFGCNYCSLSVLKLRSLKTIFFPSSQTGKLTVCTRGPNTTALSTQRPVITTSAPRSKARAMGPAL